MISSICLSTIAHSTEDISKVKGAILNLLPLSLRNYRTISEQEAQGHHGNSIWLLTLDLREKKPAAEISDYLLRSLPVADRLHLRDQLDLYFDGRSAIFLRLDKQSAFLGSLRLSNGDDVIRVKIGFLGTRGERSEVLRLFGLC